MSVNNLATAGGANPPPVAQPSTATSFTLTHELAACDKQIDFNTKNVGTLKGWHRERFMKRSLPTIIAQ